MDLDAYLTRLGLDPGRVRCADLAGGSRQEAEELLRRLHVAHLRCVPFESLDIQLGHPISLDPRALFDKLVWRRRGGFCYELNGLFALLLEALGFTVRLLSARVHGSRGLGPEYDHLLLAVPIGTRTWLADVGFGDSHLEPLLLREGQDGRHRLRRTPSSGGWELVESVAGDEPQPRHRFEVTPRRLEEFGPMCAFHGGSPDSHFSRRTICTRATESGRVTLLDTTRVETVGGERRERRLGDLASFLGCLGDDFGIDLGDEAPRAWEAAQRTASLAR